MSAPAVPLARIDDSGVHPAPARALAPLRPLDVVVVLKLVGLAGQPWDAIAIAAALGVTPDDVRAAIARLDDARLVHPGTRRVARAALLDFLARGVPYAFPAVVGAASSGTPTAASVEPLRSALVMGDADGFVWPGAGDARGRAVLPLDPSAPAAAGRDPALHELLALVDALRVGRARDRALALEALRSRLAA